MSVPVIITDREVSMPDAPSVRSRPLDCIRPLKYKMSFAVPDTSQDTFQPMKLGVQDMPTGPMIVTDYHMMLRPANHMGTINPEPHEFEMNINGNKLRFSLSAVKNQFSLTLQPLTSSMANNLIMLARGSLSVQDLGLTLCPGGMDMDVLATSPLFPRVVEHKAFQMQVQYNTINDYSYRVPVDILEPLLRDYYRESARRYFVGTFPSELTMSHRHWSSRGTLVSPSTMSHFTFSPAILDVQLSGFVKENLQ